MYDGRLLPRHANLLVKARRSVKTPGSPDRGARRLIGGGTTTDPAFVYYTADHYASFASWTKTPERLSVAFERISR
jgi:guanyl-specific ribonuclease Sa